MTPKPPRESNEQKLDEYLGRLKAQMRYRHTADLIVRSDGVEGV